MNNPSTRPLWIHALLMAVLFYALAVGYNFLYWQEFRIASLSESLAFAGGILIGGSFALSGITYFWDFLDTHLKYRKYLGLVGYYLALAYSVTLVFRFPDRYLSNFFTTLFQFEALTGLAAMAIFTMMAIISGNWAVKILGGSWRPLLRLGYLAYLLLILRAFNIEGGAWWSWATQLNGLPPARLLLTIFALLVIDLRIILEICLRLEKREAKTQTLPNPQTKETPPTPA